LRIQTLALVQEDLRYFCSISLLNKRSRLAKEGIKWILLNTIIMQLLSAIFHLKLVLFNAFEIKKKKEGDLVIYLLGSLVFILCSLFVMVRFNVKNPISKGAGLAILLCLLANISLAENVATNLLPQQNDGYSISSGVATWILGDDGGTLEGFKDAFSVSIYITLFLIGLYVFISVLETRLVFSKSRL
jgi:hypothetical protein